jgi:excisionase family DNA binding protein
MTESITRQSWQASEVAISLGVPYRTVLDLIHAGKLGHIRAGRYYLVPDVELQRYLAQGIQAGAA